MPIDTAFIRTLEGFDPEGNANVPVDESGVPLGTSGVTLPGGIDLGQQDLASLRKLGLDPKFINQIKPYVGLKGKVALDALNTNPLQVDPVNAERLSEEVMSRDFSRLANEFEKASGRPFNELPPSIQTVIASVGHQYGNLAKKTPNFWSQVTTGKFDKALENLRNFGDKYPTRRNKEADLFQQGIISTFLEGQ